MIKKIVYITLSLVLIVTAGLYFRNQGNSGYDDIMIGNSLSYQPFSVNNYQTQTDKEQITYNIIVPSNFDLVAENDELALYVEPETLAIAVKVKENGYVYSSYNFNDSFAGKAPGVVNPIKSGITIDLYKETTPVSVTYLDTPQVLGGTNQPAATSQIIPVDQGFLAKIDFNHPEIMIKFDLHVSIADGTLTYQIPYDSIVEYNPNNWDNTKQFYILRNIVVFPYFGSTISQNDGYIILPDGSGSLVTLQANPVHRARLSRNVYGDDLGYSSPIRITRVNSVKENERITMPIYGIFHDVNNTGFLAISVNGAQYAELNFKSAGIVNDYYYTYFSYRYRRSYEQYQSRSNEDQFRISFPRDINEYDLHQTYIFLSGTSANYVQMAKAYQEFLSNTNRLGDKRRSNYDQTPTAVDVIGSEVTTGIFSNKTKAITTYEEMIEIAQKLQEAGYEDLIFNLLTYDLNDDQYNINISRALGGKKGFQDLLDTFDELGVEFSYFLDYVRIYGGSTQKFAQTLSRRTISYREISYMFYTHQVVRTRYYENFAKDDLKTLDKYNIDSVSLHGFHRAIFTGYDRETVYSDQNIMDIQKTLEVFKDGAVKTNLYLPDAYLYPYVNQYYKAPLGDSGYQFSVATIPLVQLVIGGHVDMYSDYLNFVNNERITLLRMVEFGVFPSYVLTATSAYALKETNSSNIYVSQYETLSKRISDYYDFINRGLSETANNEIVDHIFVAPGVSMVVYENGTTIVINYNNQPYDFNGTTIKALDYEVFL